MIYKGHGPRFADVDGVPVGNAMHLVEVVVPTIGELVVFWVILEGDQPPLFSETHPM
jgi:hypothetical protein